MKKIFMIGSIILLLLFTAVYFAKPKVMKLKITPTKVSHIDNTDTLCHQIDELKEKHNADCEKLLSAFFADIENNIAPDFSKANCAVSKAVDDLCGYKVCVKLCYKAAKDKIQGTNDFMDAYTAAMDAPIIQPCVHANAVASEMLQCLQLRLQEKHAQYISELAIAFNNNNFEGKLPSDDLENLQNCLGVFAGNIHEAHLKKVMAGVGITFEVVFIRETCRYIGKLFAKPVAKICGSLGTAGICTAADGPLPIGDIVGAALSIGGLAWTAWDVYDVTRIMPKKLNTELQNGIASTKEKLLEESRNQAKKIVQAYQQSGSRINQELKEQLK